MAFVVTFNGVNMPSYIGVRSVDFAVLPAVTNNIKKLTGTIGARNSGMDLGQKSIKMKIYIIPDPGKSLTAMSREFALWLRGNNFMDSPLIIGDDPTIVYQAVVNNAVDITDELFLGEGTLEFLVSSGIGKTIETVTQVDDRASGVVYGGSGWWNTTTDNSYQNSSATTSKATGDYVQYTFTGTGVKLYDATGTTKGKVDIYMDGVLDAAGVDRYAAVSGRKVLAYSRTNLPMGTHTVKAVVTGTKNASSTDYNFVFDYLEYTNSTPITYDTANSKIVIAYNGTAPTSPIFTWTPAANLTNATINFTCVETGTVTSLTGNFTAGQVITVDCDKKVVYRAGVVEMKLINFTSTWIKLSTRGTYNITYTQAGTYTCSCSENWL